MSIVWILVSVGIAILVQALLVALFGMSGVGYDRRFSRRSAYEGEQVNLVEIIRNRKILPVPWIRVESRISPNLRFGHGGQSEEREISADQYHKSVFFMGPFSQITRRHDVACLRRGHYEAGSVAMTAGDLMAMWMKTKQMNLDCALDVYKNHPQRWREMMQRAMTEDFSWKASAKEYRKLYNRLAGK